MMVSLYDQRGVLLAPTTRRETEERGPAAPGAGGDGRFWAARTGDWIEATSSMESDEEEDDE